MSSWKPYLISLAIGLLVGVERENSRIDEKALGVRTFILISLLGALAGGSQDASLSFAISIFAFGFIFLSYFIQIYSKTEIHLGLTTEFAAVLVFTASFLSHTSPMLAAMIGPVVAFILFSKESLHRFTHAIKPLELKATITLLLIAVVVIELAPDVTIDPWGLFNPKRFGYIIIILATLEFTSYLVLKMIGEKNGSLVIGFLGGLVSSTAVLISSARQAAQTENSWRTLLSATLAAQLASLVELPLIIFLISQTLFLKLISMIVVGFITGSIALIILQRKKSEQVSELVLKSPLDWKGVFRLSIIFGTVFIMISLAKHWLGDEATFALSFLTGLFELQGISLANATLFNQGELSLKVASLSIVLAILASLLAKIIISWFFGRNKFALFLTLIFLPMMGLITLTAWLAIR